MFRTTAGQLAIEGALPQQLRQTGREWDKKNTTAVLQRLAEEHPDQYRETLNKLIQLGRRYSYETGGNSFGVSDLAPAEATAAARQRIEAARRTILTNQNLSRDEKLKQLQSVVQTETSKLTGALFQEAKDKKNPLALQIMSGAKGNERNLQSLLGFDGFYEDSDGNTIPIPVLRNYAQGLSAGEYFAGAFGARKGVIDVKKSTADAGYLGKQLTQVAHRLLVSGLDDEKDPDNKARRGFPVSANDPDSVGALLAVDHGPFPRNTVITPKILAALRASGNDELLVRSPTVGGPNDHGVYARDVGWREKNRLAPYGDYVGIAAAQALTEKLVQGQLSSKHTGGIAGVGPTGFTAINQILQTPESYPGGASHAQDDGKITAIRPAPQGGQFININGTEHYLDAGLTPKVKIGDHVEAGDVLSDGLPNPAEIVKHKGIGEGRRYFTQLFTDIYNRSGFGGHRRNIELLSRGLLNHVRMNGLWGNYAPDDVVPYTTIESNWEPRAGYQTRAPKDSVGGYLERPALHYSIGTKIRKSMLPQFDRWGVKTLDTHAEPPPFEPEMQRAATAISTDEDWMPRMLGSGQQSSLLDAVHRGSSSDIAGTSYVPALAEGTSFGKVGPTKGWSTKPQT